MNYFVLDKSMKTVAIATTDSDSRDSFNVFEDTFTQYSNAPSIWEGSFDFYHDKVKELDEGGYIVFEYQGKYRLFLITSIEEYHGEDSYVKVYAEESSMELINAVVLPNDYHSTNAEYLLGIALADTDWEVGEVDDIIIESYEFGAYETSLNQVQAIAEAAEGVLTFRVDFSPSKGVKGRYVDLQSKVEINNGKRFEFGRNVEGVRRTIDRSMICSAVIPVGSNDVLINGFDWVNYYQDKNILKRKENYYLEVNEETRQKINPNSDYHIFYPLTVESDDKSTLCQKAYEHLKNHQNPKLTYEVDATILKDEIYQIGETVRIIDDMMDISLEAEIEEMTLSFCNPENDSITLTNYREKESNIHSSLLAMQSKLQTSVLNNPLVVVSPDKPLIEQVLKVPTVWFDTSQVNEKGIVVMKQYDIENAEWMTIQQPVTKEDVDQAVEESKNYAQVLVNAQAKILHGTEFPTTGMTDNQLFINSTTNYMYRWDADTQQWYAVTGDLGEVGETVYRTELRVDEIEGTITNLVVKSDYEVDKETMTANITSNTALIQNLGNEIDSKVEKTVYEADLNTMTTRVGTVESRINQTATAISQKVDRSEWESLTVGGHNLIKNSDFYNDTNNWTDWGTASGSREIVEDIEHLTFTTAFRMEATSTGQFGYQQTGIPVIVGDDYTLSAWVRVDATTGNTGTILLNDKEFPVTDFTIGEWKRISYTFQPTATPINVFFGQANKNDYLSLTITGTQLEHGNLITDWTVSATELNRLAYSLESKYEYAESRIEADSIIDTVLSSEAFNILIDEKAGTADLEGLATLDDIKQAIEDEDFVGIVDSKMLEYLDDPQSHLNMKYVTSAQLVEEKDNIRMEFKQSGGINRVRNSLFYSGVGSSSVGWEVSSGTESYYTCGLDPDAEGLGYKSSLHMLRADNDLWCRQEVPTIVGNTYTVSFYYKKTTNSTEHTENTGFQFTIRNGSTNFIVGSASDEIIDANQYFYDATNGYQLYSMNFVAEESTSRVNFHVYPNEEVFITAVMMNEGTIPFRHQFMEGEMANTNVNFDINGIKVKQVNSSGEEIAMTEISPNQFAGYYLNPQGAMQKMFWLNNEAVCSTKSITQESVVGGVKQVALKTDAYDGVAFIPTSSNDYKLYEGEDSDDSSTGEETQ